MPLRNMRVLKRIRSKAEGLSPAAIREIIIILILLCVSIAISIPQLGEDMKKAEEFSRRQVEDRLP